MLCQDLSSAEWTVRPVGQLAEVPAAIPRAGLGAVVPGCMHTDLIRAGLLRHPREGFAEREQFWVGRTDWRYECAFEPHPALFDHDRIDLVCDGLDTIATVELNAQVIGTAANMFHPHRFDARTVLRRGPNHLAITFKSPLCHIREEESRLGPRPVNGDWDPYNFIRKAACNFGWDWAPKLPTSGIWKAIRVEAWSGVRIAGVRPLIGRTNGDVWRVDVRVDLEWSAPIDGPVPLLADIRRSPEAEILWTAGVELQPAQTQASIELDAYGPEQWWPRGLGAQPLYTLELSLHERHATSVEKAARVPLLARWSKRIGFRELGLDTAGDDHGRRFGFAVHGRHIFCKGANWIPEGLFPSEMTRGKYRERLQQAADANMNMLRVWGGGYYEDDAFYEICDELGILVWQDFMFACAMYPEEEPYPALVEAEARHQITRLSSHPSVALWCGGNECVWAYESWGHAPGETPWKERVGSKTWGRGYYFDLLPRLLAELDPTRPYWPNSPWSGSESVPPNDSNYGDRHTWDVHADGYRSIVPRFCSEFGHQSPANLATLASVLTSADLAIGSAALDHRQRATGGTARHIDECLSQRFLEPPRDFAEWHRRAQLMQAEALKVGIDSLAANRPRCMGALIWQLNDAWPGFSWSLIDSDGTPKPAYYAVKEAFGSITP